MGGVLIKKENMPWIKQFIKTTYIAGSSPRKRNYQIIKSTFPKDTDGKKSDFQKNSFGSHDPNNNYYC